jgi:hypothetical protein
VLKKRRVDVPQDHVENVEAHTWHTTRKDRREHVEEDNKLSEGNSASFSAVAKFSDLSVTRTALFNVKIP